MASASDLLEEVNTAISACLTAQSYTIRGRSKSAARLAELQAFRRELIKEINDAAANGGSMASVVEIMRPY